MKIEVRKDSSFFSKICPFYYVQMVYLISIPWFYAITLKVSILTLYQTNYENLMFSLEYFTNPELELKIKAMAQQKLSGIQGSQDM